MENHVKVGTPKFLTIFERYYSVQKGPYILGEKVCY